MPDRTSPGARRPGTLAAMLIYLAAVAGAVVWLVMWSIGLNSFDGMMVFIAFVVVAAGFHVIAPFLPGNRPGPDEKR